MLNIIPQEENDGKIPKTIFEHINPFTKEGFGAMLITLIPVNVATELGANRHAAFLVGGSVAVALTAAGRLRSERKDSVEDACRAVILPVAANYLSSTVDPSEVFDLLPSDRIVDAVKVGGVILYGAILPRATRMVRAPVLEKLSDTLRKKGEKLFPKYEAFKIDPKDSPTKTAYKVSQDTWDLLLDLHPILIGIKPEIRRLFHGDQSYLDMIETNVIELMKTRESMFSQMPESSRAFVQYMALYKSLIYINSYESEYAREITAVRLRRCRNAILDTLSTLDPLVIDAIKQYSKDVDMPEENEDFKNHLDHGTLTLSLIPELEKSGLIDGLTNHIYSQCEDTFGYKDMMRDIKSISFRDNAARGAARLLGLQMGGLASVIFKGQSSMNKKIKSAGRKISGKKGKNDS